MNYLHAIRNSEILLTTLTNICSLITFILDSILSLETAATPPAINNTCVRIVNIELNNFLFYFPFIFYFENLGLGLV